MGEENYNNNSNLTGTPLHEMITKIFADYIPARNKSTKNNRFGDYIRNTVRNIIKDEAGKILEEKRDSNENSEEDSDEYNNIENYVAKGSIGQGPWAEVSWFGIKWRGKNKEYSDSFLEGEYIVYLISNNGSSIYLTFNQGCGVYEKNYTGQVLLTILEQIAKNIREKIDAQGFLSDDKIYLGKGEKANKYKAGTIFYKEYKADAVPSESELKDDLKKMISIYQEYISRIDEFDADIAQILKDKPKKKKSAATIKNTDQDIMSGNKTISNETTTANSSNQDMKNGESLTVKQKIEHIKSYIEAKGFSYENGLIENFYLSLKAKPFVILAGTSGTGKSRLVRLFAEAVGATIKNGRFKMVPVRPDWSDSSDLFGHVNLNGKFIPGEIIDFIKKAEDHPAYPFFLCLDEMNLARVEYYLSDILSVMETREIKKYPDGERIETDPIITELYYGDDATAKENYGNITIPDNLYIIGTVNMDETTFPFSRKVLDRANTIEFSYVDLKSGLAVNKGTTPEPVELDNSFFKAKYLLLSQCEEQDTKTYCKKLKEINNILYTAGAQIGYRVRDEVIFYMLYNKEYDILDKEVAFDYELMQKILPRISGSSSAVRDMLRDLFKICVECYEPNGNDSISSKMREALDEAIKHDKAIKQDPENAPQGGAKNICKYKRSAEKIIFMMRRLEEDGFTSYWL